MRKTLVVVLLACISLYVSAQEVEVYPPHWWIGMKNPHLQLMLHQKDIGLNATVSSNNGDVVVQSSTPGDNPNYLFVDLGIMKYTKAGVVKLTVKNTATNKSTVVNYELKERRKGNGKTYAQGVNSSDFIYMLMPDRFSNGDESNDHVAGMKDQSLNRDSIYDRHGGDLQGIMNHLDYLQSMGATALWMTPVIENDMKHRTEHGYAFTNHYKVDPRLGGDNAYKALSDALHKRGMKLIQDAVYNHIGSNHFTVIDPPFKNWLHNWPTYTNTTYKDQPLMDPYAAEIDKKRMSDGWFTRQMPDLNQDNLYVSNFLIQHALWSVEEFGVDGWRIDTYIYNDLEFMNRCNKALMEEYPNITMFGETWVHGTVNQAYFTVNNLNIPFKSNLTGVTDFQLNMYGINPALTQNFGWTEGVNKLYNTLSNDFLYKNPMNNVIFLDNHDMSRFYTQVNEDMVKLQSGLAWLFTCRGIPQLYYGTEVLMKGSSSPHDGNVRLDFPGGWKNDTKNAFTQQGLTAQEKDLQDYVKRLGNYRKNSSAIKTGKLMQYLPDDGLYVYFRYDANQTVMCVMNTSDKDKEVNLDNYEERTAGFTKATDIINNASLGKTFTVPSKHTVVAELGK